MAESGSGTLYVVATPIGNLGDITFRAVETLKAVSLILAEDTRVTKRLLSHFGIDTPLTSYHQYSRGKKYDQIFAELDAGHDLALVTDAGTPAVADPGSHLVELARQRGHADRGHQRALGGLVVRRPIHVPRLPAAQEGPADQVETAGKPAGTDRAV